MFNLFTNYEFDSVMHIHEHTCAMNVRRTCTSYMHDSVNAALGCRRIPGIRVPDA